MIFACYIYNIQKIVTYHGCTATKETHKMQKSNKYAYWAAI